MKEHTSAMSYKGEKPCVVTIGTFDGVHVGHKAILERLVATARKDGMDSVLLTFFPHPRMVLQKQSNIKLINTISEKKELLNEIGLDHLIVHPFTAEFSRLSAVEFVRDILVNALNAGKVIIGYDHRFGRNRTASIEDLKEFGEIYDFEVEEISAQEISEVTVSSTKIRKAIKTGDITTANQFLGYPFMLSGIVVKGKSIGRTIEYPTANLQIQEGYKLIPGNGVYVVFSEINGGLVYGITSIGTNPTVGGEKQTIETYFLDFDGDLYDKELRIEFITRIRGEETFESVSELKEAIQKDEEFARNFLKHFG
ncbi:MAG: bifunctional riboflavin kinase/FAD synthetase [Bacteroidia bacterium]|nr:bifunctional riboflavin kinase/FAD synthetase [Bacteroidia bacterium]NNF30729.1 bifunctional riboflavin kinase/FAD synthetase [Flavobacteriaceae bacterium]MBT8277226.1 bifunctional riboflavin kinase/FAD synthetase [Bacteroidia bacterium]NNJ80751.1 bifunctional riboflavin kinase/FAD synthetase [Flavobacteriaceae bacterium]NNK54826.1 bifunctional riboflavin kinase/FAD synthetase [Flavobacteriaceae bacterium]